MTYPTGRCATYVRNRAHSLYYAGLRFSATDGTTAENEVLNLQSGSGKYDVYRNGAPSGVYLRFIFASKSEIEKKNDQK